MKKVVIAAICKNELTNVDGFLASIGNIPTYILDTGSTDGTYEKLKEAEESSTNLRIFRRVFDIINYSDFRNCVHSLIDVPYDYVFHVDLDERLCDNWRVKLEPYLLDSPHRLKVPRLEVNQKNFITSIERIFSNNPGRWRHALHEGFMFDDQRIESSAIVNAETVKLTHHTVINQEKLMRYNAIIQQHLEEEPDHYLYFYFLHLYSDLKEYDRVVGEWERLQHVVAQLPYDFRLLIVRYVFVSKLKSLKYFDFVLLNELLTTRNKSTLYTASRYLFDAGYKELSKTFYRDFEAIGDDIANKYIAYVPYAYDQNEIERLRVALFG